MEGWPSLSWLFHGTDFHTSRIIFMAALRERTLVAAHCSGECASAHRTGSGLCFWLPMLSSRQSNAMLSWDFTFLAVVDSH